MLPQSVAIVVIKMTLSGRIDGEEQIVVSQIDNKFKVTEAILRLEVANTEQCNELCICAIPMEGH
jgi:hypothetical protein